MTAPSCGHVTNVVVTEGAHQIFFDGVVYLAGDEIIDVPLEVADYWIASGWAVSSVGEGGAGGVNEVQRFDIAGSPGSGKFTLAFNGATTDPPLPYHPNAGQVTHALEILPTIGAGNVIVTKDGNWGYVCAFGGALSEQNLPQLTAAPDAQMTGAGGSIAVSTVTEGAAPTRTAKTAKTARKQLPGRP
jgi:hypothetical protein